MGLGRGKVFHGGQHVGAELHVGDAGPIIFGYDDGDGHAGVVAVGDSSVRPASDGRR